MKVWVDYDGKSKLLRLAVSDNVEEVEASAHQALPSG